jgi:hypothetical protein
MGHHHWFAPRCHRQQCHPKPYRFRLLAYPDWRAVRLGLDPCCWHVLLARIASIPHHAWSRLTGLPADDPAVQAELNSVRDNLAAERALGESSYGDCFRSGHNQIRFRTLTGIFLQAWQQLTGINFIFYYGTTFFQNSNIKDAFLITSMLPRLLL